MTSPQIRSLIDIQKVYEMIGSHLSLIIKAERGEDVFKASALLLAMAEEVKAFSSYAPSVGLKRIPKKLRDSLEKRGLIFHDKLASSRSKIFLLTNEGRKVVEKIKHLLSPAYQISITTAALFRAVAADQITSKIWLQ